MGLTAYLSIELSCSFSYWFIHKPLNLLLNHFNPLSPSTRTCLHESPTRHSSLRVPALSGSYSRYLACARCYDMVGCGSGNAECTQSCILDLCNVVLRRYLAGIGSPSIWTLYATSLMRFMHLLWPRRRCLTW